MTYDYITDNNLYDKQNYMYSKYCGKDFLQAYVDSRKIKDLCNGSEGMKENQSQESATYCKIDQIYAELQNNVDKGRTLEELNGYVKSFEVRKRLYDEYSGWKPVDGASFENYENYLLFADCLMQAYSVTGKLKYYSCALKVDDTLLSLQCNMSAEQIVHLRKIIDKELLCFKRLLEMHGICVEVRQWC